jgi:hypothetical protein
VDGTTLRLPDGLPGTAVLLFYRGHW